MASSTGPSSPRLTWLSSSNTNNKFSTMVGVFPLSCRWHPNPTQLPVITTQANKISKLLFVCDHRLSGRRCRGAHSGRYAMWALTTNPWLLWSTLVLKSPNVSVRETWTWTPTCASGKHSLSTTFMINQQARSLSTTIQLKTVLSPFSRAITPLSLPMVRRARARLTLWRALSTTLVTPTAV